MEYPLMTPPFPARSFVVMTKEEAEQYFEWFISIKDSRIKQLECYVKEKSEEVALDLTPESLLPLWSWFEKQIELVGESEKTESVLTMALAVDIATYFGEVLIHNTHKIAWDYRTKPKKLDGVNQPILVGFAGDISVNPRRLINVCVKKSVREQDSNRLYELYQNWIQNVSCI